MIRAQAHAEILGQEGRGDLVKVLRTLAFLEWLVSEQHQEDLFTVIDIALAGCPSLSATNFL